ncbi:N-acyl-D-amino-acid deacylase [Isoptericola jiangsuensis]|uniref:N-acyl-D-amino-acid deacylase n=1 Tax=Isoptericola jiangsuensis TaxID=548579 RepID=A0A2A9EUY3_9MICO|nr:amidohydrolase family protein [Isoptericola jiangsuensis]PFG42563.1 N-acyl-D-amino-acid deacylase [Isoptericola jiangsuensis]
MRGAVDVVRGAVLPLPDGGLSEPRDLHLAGGRVSAVVPAGARPVAGRVLDAGGRIAMPGFVDSHVHAGGAVFDPAVQLALLRQGVTSIVTGADGVGYAPSDRASLLWASGYFAGIDGDHPRFSGGTVAELLATYDRATPVNVGVLVPHGTVRHLVLGTAQRRASTAEAEKMAAIAEQAFADGALGLSTGLEYVPAAWADQAELVALARVAAAHDLPHVSHMRGYEAKAARAFAELLRLSAETGVATHVSHLHGPADTLVPMLDAALDDGHDVTFDSYPYLRGCSILAMVALPTWLPLADPDATLSAIDAPALTLRLRAHLAGLDDLWPRVTLAWVPGLDPDEDVAGRPLTEVARRWGVSPGDAALRVLRASRLRASCVFAQPPTNSEESVRRLATHRAHLGGSDAIYQPVGADAAQGRPHPRGWGAFARFLRERVLESGDWSWHDAAEHLSGRAARRFRLEGRGSLVPGSVADVVLVDPATLADRATYDAPRVPATGVDDVLVAGVPVLVDGVATRSRPGRALRPGGPDGADRA